jgi:hypothetical protein
LPGRPIGPWPRRTGAPKASATGQNRSDGKASKGELGRHIGATSEWWTADSHGHWRSIVTAGQQARQVDHAGHEEARLAFTAMIPCGDCGLGLTRRFTGLVPLP